MDWTHFKTSKLTITQGESSWNGKNRDQISDELPNELHVPPYAGT